MVPHDLNAICMTDSAGFFMKNYVDQGKRKLTGRKSRGEGKALQAGCKTGNG